MAEGNSSDSSLECSLLTEAKDLEFFCENIKNMEMVLWKLLEKEVISLREQQLIKRQETLAEKCKVLFEILDGKEEDWRDALIQIFEETGNSVIAESIRESHR
ncbi:unnamed protein product [Allacma fusca]|uniref:CARD domain-containing protein n=1 Tax=Allacma fusca TaxID=39272 RepID=A0A8J2PF95_9HEXA|nr:unnamed protein product [Allacma fusca]